VSAMTTRTDDDDEGGVAMCECVRKLMDEIPSHSYRIRTSARVVVVGLVVGSLFRVSLVFAHVRTRTRLCPPVLRHNLTREFAFRLSMNNIQSAFDTQVYYDLSYSDALLQIKFTNTYATSYQSARRLGRPRTVSIVASTTSAEAASATPRSFVSAYGAPPPD